MVGWQGIVPVCPKCFVTFKTDRTSFPVFTGVVDPLLFISTADGNFFEIFMLRIRLESGMLGPDQGPSHFEET
jgi:hypothetical protein